MKRSRFHQRGLSLAEMLIGLVVGMIVIGIVGTLFITTLRGSDDTLRAMKLNQELRAAMNYMANDIRRAGFWVIAAAPDAATCPNPPYCNPYTTRTGITTDVFVANNCIMYSYDGVNNTVAPYAAPLRYAFRRAVAGGVGIIQVPASNLLDLGSGLGTSDACTQGAWAALTDPNAVNITQLDFSFEGSRCENMDALVAGVPTSWQIPVQDPFDPAGVETTSACFNAAATAAAAGDRLVESRQVRIVLTGNHVKDPTVTLTLDETIKLPNNRAVIAPGP